MVKVIKLELLIFCKAEITEVDEGETENSVGDYSKNKTIKSVSDINVAIPTIS